MFGKKKSATDGVVPMNLNLGGSTQGLKPALMNSGFDTPK